MDNLYNLMDNIPSEKSWDEINSALGTRTRRFTIYQFIENEDIEVINRRELAEKLAETREKIGAERPDPREIETKLQHSSIPKLQDLGVLEYDRRTGDVRYEGDPDLEFIASMALQYEEEHFSTSL